MSDLLILFAVLAGLAAILANIAVWSPRRTWLKVGALVTTAVLLPSGYMGFTAMLSRPKPVDFEWGRRELAEAAVLGAQMEEGKAIYLWMMLPDATEPRAYVLPWNKKMARQLRGAQQEARQSGARVRMRKPFERSYDERKRRFYAPPPPPPPLKAVPPDNPLEFHGSQSPQAGD